jgi:hypothetical protein
MTSKRQSTTAKITLKALTLIRVALLYGEGVIVRYKGREYGVIGITRDGAFEVYGSDQLIPIARCTIRKGTTAAIEDENGSGWTTSDHSFPVEIASLDSVRQSWLAVNRMRLWFDSGIDTHHMQNQAS